MPGSKGPVRAAELIALIANTPELSAERAKEAERVAALELTHMAEESAIVNDLAGLGLMIDSVWDLVNTPGRYTPEVHRCLIGHLLKRGYPDRVYESLGRSLATIDSAAYWEELIRAYLES